MYQTEQPHLQDYIQVLLRRRWVIITFFVVLVVTVLIGSLKQAPVYRAATILRIEHRTPRVVSMQEVTPMGVTGDYRTYKDYYETQYKIMASRSLLARVIDSLGFQSGEPQKRTKAIDRLGKSITVTPIKNSQLVEVSAENTDPDMAARIANTVADEYIEQNLERNINAANDASEWLVEKVDAQKEKLIDAELALQRYRQKNNINVLPQITGDNAIEEVKSKYTRLHALLANYAERYTDEHPKMIELKAQVSSLRNKIYGLEDNDAGDKTMEYRVLERDTQTSKRIYELLVARSKEIDISSTLNVNNISIIDRAEVPERPVKPNLPLNLVLAVLVGIVGGTGLGFFTEYLDTTIKSPEDIKNILGIHCLGAIPNIAEEEEFKKDKMVHLNPFSVIAEAYRTVRTEVCREMSRDDGAKTILVTSATPQAGKTVTLSNLGIAFAQNGHKVVVVDADLRKPQLHKIYNVGKRNGLSDYLLRESEIDPLIKDSGIDNLKVVTSGKASSNPAEILSSDRMDEFIDRLKERFDFVFFDTPPVISVSDSVILSEKSDALIQVIRSGKDLVPISIVAKDRLADTKANFLGIVLNDQSIYHGSYYSYHYYRYYRDAYEKAGGKRGPRDRPQKSRTEKKQLSSQPRDILRSLNDNLRNILLLIKGKFDTNRDPRKKGEDNEG